MTDPREAPRTPDEHGDAWGKAQSRQVPGPPGTSARLLVIGDTHGNLDWIRTLAKLAARFECAGAVQLGDFGLWPRPDPHGAQVVNHGWLQAVADACAYRDVWLRALDGNHDAHPIARVAFPTDDNGVRPIVDGLLDWADRGSVWMWCGVRFGALGGGVSIDRARRVEGSTWWPTEEITDADVQTLIERAGSDGVDVLLTHDAPTGVEIPGITPLHGELGRDTDRSRQRVRDAVDATRPQLVVHGHYHVRHSATLTLDDGHEVGVAGLASDQERAMWGDSWAVVELDNGRATFVDAYALSRT